ncbi:hypothetical protein TrLO_g12195 [Triparma laevis f. longispina]|uniref:Uncharacterized protein n=1 Tax=Triparma laevis f. longispina TaxID=1714387 RepID=A0A9W6ZF99_9STRA|nr:hypothetical protein TrLO_g12195 [Triparma laevis f. longispina]
MHIPVLTLLLLLLPSSLSFTFLPSALQSPLKQPFTPPKPPTPTSLFLFDFFSKKSKEGLAQITDLTSSIVQGDLKGGLEGVKEYIDQENEIFGARIGEIFESSIIGSSLTSLFSNLTPTTLDSTLLNLKDLLLSTDIGIEATEEIITEVKSIVEGNDNIGEVELTEIVRSKLIDILKLKKTPTSPSTPSGLKFSTSNLPTVYLIIGSNGMGKTTSIGKLSYRLNKVLNLKVLVAACDTYRAGAVGQLKVWGERGGVDVFSSEDVMVKNGKEVYTDEELSKIAPSTVLYSALEKAREYDCLIIDTSGRLSNNEGLNRELVKMKEVVEKVYGKEPEEIVLVVDASQAKNWVYRLNLWGWGRGWRI